MTEEVISFDRTEKSFSIVERPEKYSELFRLTKGPIIAKGAGLSYGNAAAVQEGISVDMRYFNRIHSFDPVQERITVEAGITIGELNSFLINEGYILAVLPGYPFITVGGCIAFNVHGKAQFKIGTFKDWVEALTVYHPSKGEVPCSATENPELFDLTIGGMGFTGIILTATLRLKKLAGNQLQINTINAKNIEEAVAVMQQHSGNFDYVYSWNNFNLRGDAFGKGIVYLEKITEQMVPLKKPKPFVSRLPSNKWPALWNGLTIPLMCHFYYTMNQVKPVAGPVSLYEASFPIYGKEIYYHLFGRKGFREYQVIFPYDTWPAACAEIKKLVAEEGVSIALGSLKLFRGATHNISFSGEGICVAIDVPNTEKSIRFFEKLDAITIRHNGIINLSKDSRITGELARQVFGGYDNFKQRIQTYDPEKLFRSDLRTKLGI